MLAPKYCQAKIVNNKLLCIQRKRRRDKKRQNVSAKCFSLYPPINCSSTSSRKDPNASWGFPLESSSEATALFVLRMHRRLGLEEPLDDRSVPVEGCVVQRCFASGAAPPWPKPAGRTRRNGREEKFWENFGTSKVKVLEIVATQTASWTQGTLWFWDVLRSSRSHRVGWKTCCLWYSIEAVSVDN